MPIRSHAINVVKGITRKYENEGPIAKINAHAAEVTKEILNKDNKNKSKKSKTKKDKNSSHDKKKKYIKKGQRLGEAAGNVLAMPLHFLFGRGGITAKNGYGRAAIDRLMDRGIIGYGAYYLCQGLSELAHIIGYASGFLVGAVTIPIKPKLKKDNLKWIEDCAKKHGQLSGATTAYIVTAPQAVLLNIARIPGVFLVSIGKGAGLFLGFGYSLGMKAQRKIKKLLKNKKS